MKTRYFSAVLFIGLSIAACAPKEGVKADGDQPKTANDYKPTKAQVDSMSYYFGVDVGSRIKGYNLGDVNFSQMEKGIKDFLKAKGSPRDTSFAAQFKLNLDDLNEFMNRYIQNRRMLVSLTNKEKGEAFLAANKVKEGVDTLESGLQYKIVEPGTDPKPEHLKDTVWVHYKGTHLNGEVFDECPADAEPVFFPLGGVIKGWTEGMKLIGEGGKIQLWIPADLAYGEYGNNGIEPNETLVFDVELVKVGKYVEPAPVETPAPAKKK